MRVRRDDGAAERPRVDVRTVVGVVVAIAVVTFIVVNRDEATISFVLFEARTRLWVALTAAGLGGLAVGYVLGRRR